ncbi:MAG: hypothetical protein QM820_38045 [Minicystis sp.]
MLDRVLHGEPAPPPLRDDVPAWLWPIVRRGLARDPAARFPSLSALLAALDQHRARDPDLDPAPVRRERVFAFAMLLVFVGIVIFVSPSIPFEVGTLVGISGIALAAAFVFVAVRWRRLRQNRYGRRMAALFVGALTAVLAHRLVALRLGTPVRHVIVDDLIVLATFYGVAAVAVERWVAWLSALSLAVAVASAFRPVIAPAALIVSATCSLALLLAAALRRA